MGDTTKNITLKRATLTSPQVGLNQQFCPYARRSPPNAARSGMAGANAFKTAGCMTNLAW